MTFNDLITLTDHYLGIEHLNLPIKIVTVIFMLMTAMIIIAFFFTLLTLVFHRIYHHYYAIQYKRYTNWLIKFLIDPSSPAPDADLTHRHILKNAIQDLLMITKGHEQGVLLHVYRENRFWDEDLDNLQSLYWHKRLEAIVRLDQWQICLGLTTLASIINDENKHIRQIVLKNLSRTNDPDEASFLIEKLNPDETFHSVMTEILSRLIKKHNKLVMAKLHDEARRSLVPHILKAIGDNRIIEGVPELIKHGRGQSDAILEKVIISLGKIGDPRGQNVIEENLKSGNQWIKIAAIRALFNLDADELLKHRELLLSDPNPVVRNWMVHYLNGGK